jgi:hypothetical protein
MLEVLFGCVTLFAWTTGLWYYPNCLDSCADICECQSRDSECLVMDETSARFVNDQVLIEDIVTAKRMEIGDSPVIVNRSRLPVAKPLKYS